MDRHQLVFNCGLDLVDIHLVAALHLLADNRGNSGAIIGIIDFRCLAARRIASLMRSDLNGTLQPSRFITCGVMIAPYF